MALSVVGFKSWSLGRDNDGHRTYKIKFRVQGASTADAGFGPAAVLQTVGLPVYGEIWAVNDDLDVYAYRKQEAEVEPVVTDGDPTPQWDVTCTFSTFPQSKRCYENQIEDPLLTPDRVSGDSIRYTQEETIDRFGSPIRTSSHEQIRGPQVEFDHSRDQVVIEQNVADLELALLCAMRDTVNSTEQWGCAARCIKLSSFTWEKKFYGLCFVYYTRKLTFETNIITDPTTGEVTSGWDRDLLDEGTKVLHGHWRSGGATGTGSGGLGDWVLDNIGGSPPDPNNPGHFDQFKDRNGENCRVVLDGHGKPAFTSVTTPGAYYISLTTNTGFPLSQGFFWAQVVPAGPPSPVPWSPSATYQPGNLITFGGATYLALKSTSGQPTLHPSDWQVVVLSNKGAYSPSTTYGVGDYVQDQSTASGGAAGKVHVEKYNESNFFLLGIPTVL